MNVARFLVLTASTLAMLMIGCVTIPPGHTGVFWKASGGTQPELFPEGLHPVAAWNQLFDYDLRVMSHDEILNVIAVNGLAIRLDASVRYRLVPNEVVALHREVGPLYYKKILEPVVRSEARRVIGRYTPEEIYSTRRDAIEREIRSGVKAKIAGHHLQLEAILIKNIELPEAIRQAIDQKLAAEQEVLKMRYVLEVARSRAEQKRIEARGVADYNHLVSSSINGSILEFERVRMLEQLARSPNAKTVILGGTAQKTPLVLSAPASR
jgi:prohibitin 2